MRKYLTAASVGLSIIAVGALCACSGTHQTAIGIPKVGSSGNLAHPSPLSTGTWSIEASMPTARYFLASGVLSNVLYAIGGIDALGRSSVKNEAYDPATDAWSTKAPMPMRQGALGAGVVYGSLYAVGGHTRGGSRITVEAFLPI